MENDFSDVSDYRPELPGRGQRACPDCGCVLKIRASNKQGVLCREAYYQCENLICGATFKGFEEIVYRLKVPRVMNPEVNLPLSPAMLKMQPIPPGVRRNTRDRCPECDSGIYKQITATNDPCQFQIFVECSRHGCNWAVSGVADLAPDLKSSPPQLVD